MSVLKPYHEYKETGVPWLEEVPEHWKIERAKWLFKKMDRPVRETDEVITCFRDGVVTLRKNRRVGGFTESLKEIGYQGIRRGDLVIHMMDAFAGAIGVADSDGKGTPVYSICKPNPGFNAFYYAYLVREMARSQWVLALAKGIRERSTDFRYDEFASQLVPVPPHNEQDALAHFLDHIDHHILRYIRAKRKLIKLLEEQKQVIIHQAVTHGLDPSVPLKPSGLEWLDKVPEHWAIKRLKQVAKIQTGLTLGKNYQNLITNSYPYLRVANVQHGRLDLRVIKHIDVPPEEAVGAVLKFGDVLMTEGGDIDKLGRGCVWHGEIPNCLHQNHIFAVRCLENMLLPKLLAALIISGHGRAYFQLTAKQTTNLASTNSAILRSFPILLPPIEEQHAIIEYIDSQTAVAETFIDNARRSINILHEYRTRLISDVVTGKLDVRGIVLPEESDEAAELEDWSECEVHDIEAMIDAEEVADEAD